MNRDVTKTLNYAREVCRKLLPNWSTKRAAEGPHKKAPAIGGETFSDRCFFGTGVRSEFSEQAIYIPIYIY